MPEYSKELYDWLRLLLVFGPGNKRLFDLYERTENAHILFESLYNGDNRYATPDELKEASKITDTMVTAVLEKCGELEINAYCYESEGYPQRLRMLKNPPPVIFSLGSLDFLNDDISFLEFVGSRALSEYTAGIIPKLVAPLAKLGYGIVTGNAEGSDRTVNAAARENKAPAAMFLGTSIDKDKDIEKLREFAEGGAVISELVPTSRRYVPNAFTLRNRLMTCLSDAVVICQEGQHGKGLDNISYALGQGKVIMAVPPADIFDPRYFGQRDLLRGGCPPVFSAADIVYNLRRDSMKAVDLSVLDPEQSYIYNPTEKVTAKAPSKKTKTEKPTAAEPRVPVDISGLSELSASVVKTLECEGMLMANELSDRLGVSVSEMLSELTELELEGVVTSAAGSRYKLV